MAAAPLTTSSHVAGSMDLRASRRQLLQDSLGIMVSAGGFGLVYGLSAALAPDVAYDVGAKLLLVHIAGGPAGHRVAR